MENYEVVKKVDEHEEIVVQKQDVDGVSVIAVILCLFFPPLGVLLKCGVGMELVLNIVLTFFFWIPGVLHALYVILRK